MKHIRVFEEDDLIGDLESIGFEKSVGYMYMSNTGDIPIAFLVKGKTEARCAQMIIGLAKKGWFVTPPHLKMSTSGLLGSLDFLKGETSVEDLLHLLFEQGFLPDAGYYGQFKAKDPSEAAICYKENYSVNAKAFVDLAYSHFSNADDIFKAYKSDYTESFDLKELGL